jgi:hypothetical protein
VEIQLVTGDLLKQHGSAMALMIRANRELLPGAGVSGGDSSCRRPATSRLGQKRIGPIKPTQAVVSPGYDFTQSMDHSCGSTPLLSGCVTP